MGADQKTAKEYEAVGERNTAKAGEVVGARKTACACKAAGAGAKRQPRSEPQPSFSLFDTVDELVCGVDEAGRGPLAGPVFAAAVILDPQRPIAGLRDSKKLPEAKRDALAEIIKRDALAWSIAQCSAAEIDELNILQATMLAMRRAIEGLAVTPTLALIDGNRCPVCTVRTEAIVKGDDKVAEISAASILAKTARDAVLVQMHAQYPDYGFDQHKGYPTALHLERLRAHGVTPEHRRSYAPVRQLLVD